MTIEIFRNNDRSVLDRVSVLDEFSHTRPEDRSELFQLWLRHFLDSAVSKSKTPWMSFLESEGVGIHDHVLVIGSPAITLTICMSRRNDDESHPVTCLPVETSSSCPDSDKARVWSDLLSEIDRCKIEVPGLNKIYRPIKTLSEESHPARVVILDVSAHDEWPSVTDLMSHLTDENSFVVLLGEKLPAGEDLTNHFRIVFEDQESVVFKRR